MSRVSRSVILPSSPADVWSAVIDSDRLGGWLGGDVRFVPEVGANLHYSSPDEERYGYVVDLIPERRLELWWAPLGFGAASTVRIDLTPVDGGTEVSVTEDLAESDPDDVEPRFVRQAGFGDRPLAVVR